MDGPEVRVGCCAVGCCGVGCCVWVAADCGVLRVGCCSWCCVWGAAGCGVRCGVLRLLKTEDQKMEEMGISQGQIIGIYILGHFGNFGYRVLYGFLYGSGHGSGLGFFNKTRTRPGPVSGFFFLNPYPTLFLIRPGKTRPIRVGPGRVSADRVKIAIPNASCQQSAYETRI